MNNRIRSFLNNASEIQKIFWADEKNRKKTCQIELSNWELTLKFEDVKLFPYQFLEPLSNYCIKKKVKWMIYTLDTGEMQIKIWK